MKQDKTIYWILLGVAAVALAMGGGAVVVQMTAERERMRRLLRDAATRWGLNPDWLDAIGYVESRWRSTATNMTGADLARGGAIGATQITMQTARAHGYTGTAEDLLNSPETQAELSAQILAAGNPQTLEDAGAWWNAGKKTFAALSYSSSARIDYVPKLQRALEVVQDSVVA